MHTQKSDIKYEPRNYRTLRNEGRFKYFRAGYLETDLLIGVDKKFFSKEMRLLALNKIINLRKNLERYIDDNPEFRSTLSPVQFEGKFLPGIAANMIDASRKSGTGPMAAVAGAFAQEIGKSLKKEFDIDEIIVENGGDVYLDINKDVLINIHAGESPLSDTIGIRIKAEDSPCGVCTSSGQVGHSFSYGKADALVIQAKDTALADALATSYCNRTDSRESALDIIEEIKKNDDIISAAIIIGDFFTCCGKIELEFL